MIKAMGYTNTETGWIVMIPYIFSMLILWLMGVSSDRTGKRALHFSLSALIAAAGYMVAAVGGNDAIVIAGFCLVSGGVYAGLSTFWTVPPSGGRTAMASITAAASSVPSQRKLAVAW